MNKAAADAVAFFNDPRKLAFRGLCKIDDLFIAAIAKTSFLGRGHAVPVLMARLGNGQYGLHIGFSLPLN